MAESSTSVVATPSPESFRRFVSASKFEDSSAVQILSTASAAATGTKALGKAAMKNSAIAAGKAAAVTVVTIKGATKGAKGTVAATATGVQRVVAKVKSPISSYSYRRLVDE